jgi:hypothetical protein
MNQPLYCPSCGKEIERSKLKFKVPFPCPSCQKLLHTPSFYLFIPGFITIIACAIIGFLFGLRDTSLLIFVIVFWVPITTFTFAVLRLTLNPSITEYHSNGLDLRL